ncbi:unnamed protein product, partial [Vitis vinifera]
MSFFFLFSCFFYSSNFHIELFSKASFCTNPSSVLLRIQPFCCSTPAYEPKLWSLGFIHAHFEISTWYGGNHKKLQKELISYIHLGWQVGRLALLSYFYEMICQLNHYGVVLRKPTSAHTLSFTPLRIRYFHCCRPANYLKLESSIPGRRVSRVVRTEAQDVLFDYLHCTRSFHLTDAEHMSKNSPHFLQKLLSKVENEQDVARSLSKFLRYNPINEFEPFFESLGLAPSEISALLPRNLMFLSDDCVMIENYHVLCDYGIARSSIGRMYKEVQAIFRYELGLLGSKVRAYEGLGLSRSTVIKLVSCCPWLLVGGVNSQFVMVLKRVKGLGFESDWIGGYLSGKSSYNWKRMHDTIDFLEKVGYSEEQMVSLFKTNPELLFEGSGKKFYAVGFLFEIGMKVEDIVSIVSSHVQLLKHLEKTTFLLRLGYVENSDEMFKALKLFRGRGDQLQERFDCLVQAGLDCNVVSNMIKQAPSVLNQTKYVIEKKIDCLRNCLGYPLQSVVAFPSYLCYDIERINLRFSMYVWLRDKGNHYLEAKSYPNLHSYIHDVLPKMKRSDINKLIC